jgi:hypothetical protein
MNNSIIKSNGVLTALVTFTLFSIASALNWQNKVNGFLMDTDRSFNVRFIKRK